MIMSVIWGVGMLFVAAYCTRHTVWDFRARRPFWLLTGAGCTLVTLGQGVLLIAYGLAAMSM